VIELVGEGKLELRDCTRRPQAAQEAHIFQEYVVLAQSAQLLEGLLRGGIGRDAHRLYLAVNPGKLVPLFFAEQRPVRDDIELELRATLVVDQLKQLA